MCPLQTGRAGTQVVVVPSRSASFNFSHLPIYSSLSLIASSTDDSPATTASPDIKRTGPEPIGPKPRLDNTTETDTPDTRCTLLVRCQSPVDVDKHSYSI